LPGKTVAVIGHTDESAWVAIHASKFAKKVTLLTHGKRLFEGDVVDNKRRQETVKAMDRAGIEVVGSEIKELFGLKEDLFGVKLADGSELKFDRGLVALGFFKVQNEVAIEMGAKLSSDGFVETDDDMRVLDKRGDPILGVYAVGDITTDWKQIPVGWGDAETAILHIHAEYLWKD
jgi:thioredoxin reductase